MLLLFKKAKYIVIVLFILYSATFIAGYLSGKLQLADFNELRKSPLVKFSSTLEYKVPGYGDLLHSYKTRHDTLRNSLLAGKKFWGIGALIFVNNFFITNITMVIRSLFVFPIILNVYGKFFQGVVLAQVPTSTLTWGTIIMEFGGYFLTVSGTVSGVLWAVFYKRFDFASRKEAVLSGVRLIGCMFVLSGFCILIGTVLEVFWLKSLIGKFM